MASLNSRGQLLLGRGIVSVDNRQLFVGAALGWLMDDLILYGGTGDLTMRTCNVQNGEVIELPEGKGLGFNYGVACGGSWAAKVPADGRWLMYGTLPNELGAQPHAVGRLGTIGIIREGVGNLVLVQPGALVSLVAAGPDEAVYTPQIIDPFTAVWNTTRGVVRVTSNLTVPTLPPGGGGTIRRFELLDGPWACHYMAGVGFVAHPWNDPTRGLIAPATVDGMYNTDAIVWQGGILLGGARGPGEFPGEGRTHWFNPADTRIDLTKLTASPLPPPPPPPEDPVSIPDHAALVRAAAAGADTSSLLGLLAIPVKVAWALKGEGCGLLERPNGGENTVAFHGKTYSISRVVYQGGQLFKILSDAGPGGSNGPQWADEGPLNHPPDRYAPAIDPALLGSGPIDVPPPVDLPPDASVARRLSELERLVAELRGMLNDTARELGRAIAALEGPRRMAIRSARGRYLRDDWDDSLGHFDRTTAESGETYTLEPQ